MKPPILAKNAEFSQFTAMKTRQNNLFRPFCSATSRSGICRHCQFRRLQCIGAQRYGLVSEVFKEATLQKLIGKLAIGHVRYSTTGSSTLSNAQPFLVHFGEEYYALGITAILSTRRNCVKSLKAAARFFNRRWIVK